MFCKQSEVCFNSTVVQFGLSCYLCVKLFSHFVNVVDSCALAPFPQFCDRHCFVDMNFFYLRGVFRGECHAVYRQGRLPSGDDPHNSGPIQWARGDVGLKPSAAARPWALASYEWRAAAPGLKPLRLPRARSPGTGEGGD